MSSSEEMPSSEEKPSSGEKLETAVADEKGLGANIDDDNLDGDSKPKFHNGEPVIATGRDVSRFVVDIRDDEDPALTFRSMFLGTIFAGMGAALVQVSKFKNLINNDSNNAVT